MEDKSAGESAGELADELESSGVGPAVLASAGSVALSWYYFYVRGDRQQGQFVGLWPPTILAFATFLKLTKMQEERKGSESGSDSYDD